MRKVISKEIIKRKIQLTSNWFTNAAIPVYPDVFFSYGNLSTGGKYGIGSRGAKSANKFAGRN